jgi:prepilin-type N-terminal cleavage/methylation domain-containing protein
MSPCLRCRAIRTRRGRPRTGFTLTELLLSTAIMGILMTGLASAILIASRALPDEGSVGSAVVGSAGVADQIVEELRAAIWIRERTPTAVSFTVPDRDADAVPESIRYAWSGTPGDPLTRQYNGGSVVHVLDDVHEFDLAYDLRMVTEEYPGPGIESAEILLAS